MKIAFVCTYFDGPELDSITTSFYDELVRTQQHDGNELTIISLTDGEAGDLEISGVRHIRLRFDRERYKHLENLGFAPALSWNLGRAMDLYRQAADVVDSLGVELVQCTKAIDAIGWLAADSLPVAVFSVTPQFEIMGHDFDRQYNQFDTEMVSMLEIMCLSAAGVVAAPSNELREIIATVSGIAAHKLAQYLVPFAICRDVDDLAETSISTDIPTIAYLGGLERYKGVDVLVESLALLRDRLPAFRLVVAGESPTLLGQLSLETVLKARLSELGLANHVEFLPPRNRKERRRLFKSAHAIVFPFRYCGCMSHLLEAMSDGAAVIASRVGSINEKLANLRDAFLVPAEDPTALASAIEQVLVDAGLRARLQEGARSFIEREYGARQERAAIAALSARAVSEYSAGASAAANQLLRRALSAAEDLCRHGYIARALEKTYSDGATQAWSAAYEAGRAAAAAPRGHSLVLSEIMQGLLRAKGR